MESVFVVLVRLYGLESIADGVIIASLIWEPSHA